MHEKRGMAVDDDDGGCWTGGGLLGCVGFLANVNDDCFIAIILLSFFVLR